MILIGVSLAGVILFILLFWTPIARRMTFFWRGVLFLIIVSIGIGFLLRSVWPAVVWGSLMLVVFTHFPVTADRSLTVFLLGYMRTKNRTYTEADLTGVLSEIYLKKHKAVHKRIAEQLETGTILAKGNGYRITPRGIRLMRVYSVITGLFHLPKIGSTYE